MMPPCKDCPDRWAECHANCEKWAKYEEARNAAYKEKNKAGEIAHALRCMEIERVGKIRRGKLHVKKRKDRGTNEL